MSYSPRKVLTDEFRWCRIPTIERRFYFGTNWKTKVRESKIRTINDLDDQGRTAVGRRGSRKRQRVAKESCGMVCEKVFRDVSKNPQEVKNGVNYPSGQLVVNA